jgi:hypothetical protein
MSDDLDDDFSSFGQPAAPLPGAAVAAIIGAKPADSDDDDDEFSEFNVPAKPPVTTAKSAVDDDDDDDDDEFAEVRSGARSVLFTELAASLTSAVALASPAGSTPSSPRHALESRC